MPFFPFHFGVSLLKLNSRKKGYLYYRWVTREPRYYYTPKGLGAYGYAGCRPLQTVWLSGFCTAGMVPRASTETPRSYSPPSVDRIWLWVVHNKIPMYPIFYLLKGDYNPKAAQTQNPKRSCIWHLHSSKAMLLAPHARQSRAKP